MENNTKRTRCSSPPPPEEVATAPHPSSPKIPYEDAPSFLKKLVERSKFELKVVQPGSDLQAARGKVFRAEAGAVVLEVQEKFQLSVGASPGQYIYVLHFNNEQKMRCVFPNKLDTNNVVPHTGELRVPSNFEERPYLSFCKGEHLEWDHLYAISSRTPLEDTVNIEALLRDLDIKQYQGSVRLCILDVLLVKCSSAE
jgi:hypothetical protein